MGKIHTDNGIIGLGETWYAPTVVEAAIDDHFGPLIIGRDPRNVELYWETLDTSGKGIKLRTEKMEREIQSLRKYRGPISK